MKKNPINLLQDPPGQVLRRMTGPMIIGTITMMLFNLVDTFFVGQLGTAPLAAVSFTFPVTFTVISLSIGLGIGTSAVVARFQGENKPEEVKRISTHAILLAAILVFVLSMLGYATIYPLFTALGAEPELIPLIHDYIGIWYLGVCFVVIPMNLNSSMRALGNTLVPSLVMGGAGIINGILDPLLIFGLGPFPELGVKGAAIATVISWATACIALFFTPTVQHKLIQFEMPRWAQVKNSWRMLLRIAIPAAGANMLTPISAAIVTAMIAQLGSEAVAAFGVAARVESIAMIVILSLSMTLPPFVSQNFGANRFDRVREGITKAFIFSLGWQLFIYLILFIAAPFIAEAFSDHPDVIENITLWLRIVPLAYGAQGVVILTNSSMNALHKPMRAVVLSVVRLFIFYIPFAYVGLQLDQWEGLVICLALGYFLMGCISAITLYRTAELRDLSQSQQEVAEASRS